MKILGIGGTNGSGKDTVSKMLADDYGWLFISGSTDLLIPELKRRGLPLERENMAALSAEWRRELGMGGMINKAVEKYNQSSQKYNGLVVSSLRHPGEAERIHELGGQVIWVDANSHIRYKRIYNRRQGDKDQKTFKEFLAEEKKEMHQSGDEATLQTTAVKAKADIFIENNDSLENVRDQVKKALNP